MALFESYERRIDKINGVLAQYGIGSVEECREHLQGHRASTPMRSSRSIQPICFENACWAYCRGRGHRPEDRRQDCRRGRRG